MTRYGLFMPSKIPCYISKNCYTLMYRKISCEGGDRSGLSNVYESVSPRGRRLLVSDNAVPHSFRRGGIAVYMVLLA